MNYALVLSDELLKCYYDFQNGKVNDRQLLEKFLSYYHAPHKTTVEQLERIGYDDPVLTRVSTIFSGSWWIRFALSTLQFLSFRLVYNDESFTWERTTNKLRFKNKDNMSDIKNNDIIETDADTADEDRNESGGLYPYDPTKEDIDIRQDPHTVFELLRKYDQGKLIINPDFQRNLVWKSEQKSKFIESIILNFPLPPFYVNQTREGKYIMVDGLQRTSTLHEFVNNEFKLTGLEALPKLNGYNFSELIEQPGDYQTRIEDKKLLLYFIRPSVPIKVVYDIFNRINTSGTMLNRQEVRNCIFIGKATQLLKELSEQDSFKKAIDDGISPKRMKDREAVLRYLAFQILEYKTDYHGDMSDFVEEAMRTINLMADEEIAELKSDFERVMTLTFDFFGKRNFRLPTGQTRGRINLAVFESVSYFFSIKTDAFLQKHQKAIQCHFDKLLKDTAYLEAVRVSTANTAKVTTRFKRVQEILGEV
jgi:uncharacterized protein with ParB-like and HNH nuclease domain